MIQLVWRGYVLGGYSFRTIGPDCTDCYLNNIYSGIGYDTSVEEAASDLGASR